MTTSFHRPELEPRPRLYVLMARGPLLRRIYRRFVANLAEGAPPDACLLDVGAGPGFLLGYLSRRGPDLKLVGLDAAFQMLRRGRRPFTRLAPGAVLRIGQSPQGRDQKAVIICDFFPFYSPLSKERAGGNTFLWLDFSALLL